MKRSAMAMTTGLALVMMGASGCGHAARDPSLAAGGEAPTSAQASSAAIQQAITEGDGGGLALSDEVKRLCPGVSAPEFGYDSSQVREAWRATLRGLATCMETGGLASRRLLLTGHTDPRGDDDYNVTLGGRRASSVRSALETLGVPAVRVDVTSRGKVDATGTEEKSWQKDRRVDIDVAKG